jgi:mercuric ion transport protein
MADRRGIAAPVAAIGAAFLASLCCIGPLVFVSFGVGAGLASRFEPLRPVFSVLTIGLLAVGFHVVYGREPVTAACDANGRCIVPRNCARDRILLWLATVVAIMVLTFPQWSLWFV